MFDTRGTVGHCHSILFYHVALDRNPGPGYNTLPSGHLTLEQR